MRKFLSLILALIMLLSFSVIAHAGNGDGTGGGDGSQNEYDAEVDGPGSLTFKGLAETNTFSINNVSIPFEMDSNPTGGLKHVDSANMSATINSLTVTLTCNGAEVKTFDFTLSDIYCIEANKHRAAFTINIDSSALSVGNTYVLIIKAGATWSNKPKNTATLASDFSYTFTVVEEEVVVETTTAASKQVSPLVTQAVNEETTTSIEETTTEITTVATTEAVTTVVEAEPVMNDGGSSTPVEITLGASAVVLAVLCVVRKKMVF